MEKVSMSIEEMKDFVVKNFEGDEYNKFVRFEEKNNKIFVVYLPIDPGTEDKVEIREFVNSQLPGDEELA